MGNVETQIVDGFGSRHGKEASGFDHYGLFSRSSKCPVGNLGALRLRCTIAPVTDLHYSLFYLQSVLDHALPSPQ